MNASTELLELYRATHYDVRMPGGKRVSLRIGDKIPLALVDWANDDWPLVYISACNPRSENLPAEDNRQRMRALLDRLGSQHARTLAGVGHLPGQNWREPSLLVARLTIEQADSLALDFDQNAVVIARINSPIRLRIYRKEWGSLLDRIGGLEAADKLD